MCWEQTLMQITTFPYANPFFSVYQAIPGDVKGYNGVARLTTAKCQSVNFCTAQPPIYSNLFESFHLIFEFSFFVGVLQSQNISDCLLVERNRLTANKKREHQIFQQSRLFMICISNDFYTWQSG